MREKEGTDSMRTNSEINSKLTNEMFVLLLLPDFVLGDGHRFTVSFPVTVHVWFGIPIDSFQSKIVRNPVVKD